MSNGSSCSSKFTDNDLNNYKVSIPNEELLNNYTELVEAYI